MTPEQVRKLARSLLSSIDSGGLADEWCSAIVFARPSPSEDDTTDIVMITNMRDDITKAIFAKLSTGDITSTGCPVCTPEAPEGSDPRMN